MDVRGLGYLFRGITALFLKPQVAFGLNPEDFFEFEYYVSSNNLKGLDRLSALNHYLKIGQQKDLSPSQLFVADYYKKQLAIANIDSPKKGMNSMQHWLNVGIKEKIVPTPHFSESYYLDKNQDVKDVFDFGFVHYLKYGRHEGRVHKSFYMSEQTLNLNLDTISNVLRINPSIEKLISLIGSFYSSETIKDCFLLPVLYYSLDALEIDFTIILDLFDADYYCKESGFDKYSAYNELLGHFLITGIWRGFSPSPLFDTHLVRSRLNCVNKDASSLEWGSIPTLLRWLSPKVNQKISPCPLFDAEFYKTRYDDLKEYRESTFIHYLKHGQAEGRSPNFFYDSRWVKERHNIVSFRDFLVRPSKQCLATNLFLEAILKYADQSDFEISSMEKLIEKSSLLLQKYGYESSKIALSLWSPTLICPLENLGLFIDSILENECNNTFLFDAQYYNDRIDRLNLTRGLSDVGIDHFLKNCIVDRVVPTSSFNDQDYLELNSDLDPAEIWPFIHFITYGIFEGRRVAVQPTLIIAEPRPSSREDNMIWNYKKFWNTNILYLAKHNDYGAFSSTRKLVGRAISSRDFSDELLLARALEPAIPDVEDVFDVLCPPIFDIRFVAFERIIERLKETHPSSIVCVPWIQLGGADLVSCLLAKALQKNANGENVLILITDHDVVKAPHWIPVGVNCISIADILESLSESDKVYVLYCTFIYISPRRIFNVNSRVCWNTISRFGRVLRLYIDLFAYLFCWDYDMRGYRVGYPSEYFAACLPYLKALVLDSDYLRRELMAIYNPPSLTQKKMVTIRTPSLSKPFTTPAHSTASITTNPVSKKVVLWAGRFDRQKRFDLFLQIACQMPHVVFECWGMALMDKDIYSSMKIPPNVNMRGSYRTIEDLRLDLVDVFLFTSSWEGIPTTLIEVGSRGTPIVASDVGGVSELVGENCGWLIDGLEGPQAYIDALEDALSNESKRLEYAENLKLRVIRDFDIDTYESRILSTIE